MKYLLLLLFVGCVQSESGIVNDKMKCEAMFLDKEDYQITRCINRREVCYILKGRGSIIQEKSGWQKYAPDADTKISCFRY